MNIVNKKQNISLGAYGFALAVLGVPFSGGSLSLMYYYPVVILTIGLMTLSLCKEKFHIQSQHIYVLILLLISVWHLDTSIQYFETSKTLVSLILFFIMFFVGTLHQATLKEIRLVSRCFAWSGVIIACLLLVFKQEYEMGRYSYPVGSRLVEVNYLACYLSISFLFMFHKLLTTRKLIKIPYLCGAFLVLYALFLTGSRGAFLAVGISSSILLFYNPKNAVLKLFLLGILFLLGLLLLPDTLTERFLHRSYNDGSNQMRVRLFANALNYIIQKPLLGYGVASGKAITNFGSAHNTFLSVLLNFGLVGLLMYLGILFKNFKIILQRDMLLFVAVFVDLFITSMIITNYNTIPFWFTIMFFVWVTNYKMQNPTLSLWNNL